MTDTQHTPGPWVIVTATVGVNETIFHDPPQIVCEQGSFIADADRRNARLIAAAPDLLAALQAVADYLPVSGILLRNDIDAAIHAAIAKATGK